MGIVVSPAFTAYTTGRKVVHTFLHALIAEIVIGTEGIDLIWCNLPEILDEFGHFVDAAPEFVAKGEHAEGGMMAIGAQDIFAFLVEELHQHGVLIVEIAPEGKFWLQDDAQFVSCDEGSLWRAP